MGSPLFIPLFSTMPWPKSLDFRDCFRFTDIAAAVCQLDVMSYRRSAKRPLDGRDQTFRNQDVHCLS